MALSCEVSTHNDGLKNGPSAMRRHPLVGIELELWVSNWVVGRQDAIEWYPGLTELRKVRDFLIETTGIPFQAEHRTRGYSQRKVARKAGKVLDPKPQRHGWLVGSDESLEPGESPLRHSIGVEIKTPPLRQDIAITQLGEIWRVINDEEVSIADGQTGLHINLSSPKFDPEDAVDLLILDPLRRSVPRSRHMSTPMRDIVIAGIACRADSIPELRTIAKRLAITERGSYATNIEPMLSGLGYIECRHHNSARFLRHGAPAVDAFATSMLDEMEFFDDNRPTVERRWQRSLDTIRAIRASPYNAQIEASREFVTSHNGPPRFDLDGISIAEVRKTSIALLTIHAICQLGCNRGGIDVSAQLRSRALNEYINFVDQEDVSRHGVDGGASTESPDEDVESLHMPLRAQNHSSDHTAAFLP